MSEELKSCPFCGGAANIKVATYAKGKYLVECSSEDCPQYTVDTKTVAIKAWNTRAEPKLNHEFQNKDYLTASPRMCVASLIGKVNNLRQFAQRSDYNTKVMVGELEDMATILNKHLNDLKGKV